MQTLYDRLLEGIERNSRQDSISIKTRTESFNYSQLISLVNDFSFYIPVNSTISIILPNSLGFIVAFLAINRNHSIAAPINPNLHSMELLKFIEMINPDLIITTEQISNINNIPQIFIDIDKGRFSNSTISTLGNDSLSFVSLSSQSSSSFSSFESSKKINNEIKEQVDNETEANDEIRNENSEKALLLHTSGTTGIPKRVILTNSNILYSIKVLSGKLKLSPCDSCLLLMPLFHVHGLIGCMLNTLIESGGTLLVFSPKFHVTTVINDLKEATWTSCVPTIYQMIISHLSSSSNCSMEGECGEVEKRKEELNELKRLGKLRFLRSCSSLLNGKVKEELKRLFGNVSIIQSYGSTETSHYISSQEVGGDCNGMDVGENDDSNIMILPDGQIAVKGPNIVKKEFYNHGNGTDLVNLSINGNEITSPANNAFFHTWFKTGDLGEIGKNDNRLHVRGRIKEIINRGGEKISPMEIENVIMELVGIEEAVAFSIPDPIYGESVGLLVKSNRVKREEIQKWCNEKLTRFKIPEYIEITTGEISKSSIGKVERSKMAKELGLLNK